MRFFFLVILLISISWTAFSQPGDPGGGGNPTVPITGIEILIGIGSLFGASRFLKGKNKSKES
jgi:hypothetical protein